MLKKQTCKKCSKEMRFEFVVKDKIWDRLPNEWHSRVLCIECFLEELEMTSPKQKIDIDDFLFLSITGDLENDDFGGILHDTEVAEI